MFDISGIYIHELPKFINISTQAAIESIDDHITHWSSVPSVLKARSEKARRLRKALRSNTTLRPLFTEFASVEPTVREFLSESSELEKEGYSQIFFKQKGLTFLNQMPFLIATLTFMSKYIFPTMMASLPILTIVAPYIIVKYIMGMNISVGQYFEIASRMYLGGGGGGADGGSGGLSKLKTIVQLIVFAITTVQSTYQPIQTARHISAIDKTIQEKGSVLQKALQIYLAIRAELDTYGIDSLPIHVPTDIFNDSRRLVAFFIDSPFYARLILNWIGSWDVAVGFAQTSACTHVKWLARNHTPEINIKMTCDTRISPDKQRPFDIHLRGHTLLTGPNRGGKSTVLRALLRSLLLAHTFGVAIGNTCEMTPFDWVMTSLRIEDLPGSESLFEREVNFAKETLTRGRRGCGLVCVDELFHSTNPPDAERTSRAYLKALWTKSNIVSMISTHIFQIAKDAPDVIQKVCCPAEESATGVVTYKYGLEKGICMVSSVNEIIRGAFDN